jgi:D-xylose transport system substrate-binding protein
MNDGIAGGAIAALQGQGVDPLPPVVGMDQEISAIQRILAGQQLSSSSTGPIEQAYAAGKVVAALAQGQTVEFDGTVDYGSGEINSINFQVPGSVTISQIQEVLLDRDVYTYDEICTADFKSACDAAGLKPRE